MDRAVPLTICRALVRSLVFKSGIFCDAISSACFKVTLPALTRLGSPEALARPAAHFKSAATGGIFVMNVKERSS